MIAKILEEDVGDLDQVFLEILTMSIAPLCKHLGQMPWHSSHSQIEEPVHFW